MATGMEGYRAAIEDTRATNTNNLQQLTGAVGIAQHLKEMANSDAFRSEIQALGPTATSEARAAVALKYAKPDAVMTSQTAHMDRQATQENTKQLALARLQQSAIQAKTMFELKDRLATNQEQRDQNKANYQQFEMGLQAEAMRVSGQRLNYDTGMTGGTPPAVPTPVAPPAPNAPAQPSVMPDQRPQFMQPKMPADVAAGVQQLNAQVPQQIAAAAPIVARESMPNGGGAIPTNTVVPSVAPPPTAPMNTPKPLTLADAPPELPMRAKVEWLKQNSKAGSGAGALGNRESVFINRVVLSANEAARDLDNVVKLPMSSSRGLFGGRGQPEGIFNAGKETLANAMTTQDVQSYNVLATGFQRSLAAIEAAGLAPSGSLSHQMDAIIFKEGDTNYTKLQKLAQTRQIVEAGLETIVANPRVPQETRDHVNGILKKIEKSVPFTQSDLIELKQAQQIDPKITLKDIVKKMGGAPSTYADTEKEKRYQEWKKNNP